MTPSGHMTIEARWFNGCHWYMSSQNRVVLQISESLNIEVWRPRNWKKLKLDKPWHIRMFGVWGPERGSATNFAKIEDAQYVAERDAFNHLGRVADKFFKAQRTVR